jgi:hypothetical protein
MRDYLTLRDKNYQSKIFVILQNAIQDSKAGNRLITRGKRSRDSTRIRNILFPVFSTNLCLLISFIKERFLKNNHFIIDNLLLVD